MIIADKVMKEIREAVEAYTGTTGLSILAYPDPSLEGVYAVRLTLEGQDGVVLDFLLTRNPRTSLEMEGERELFDIEEVQWKTWPPEVRKW